MVVRVQPGQDQGTHMKLLFLDLETSPTVAHVWALFNQNVSLNQVMESTEVICFAAKWYDKPTTMFYSTHHHGKEAMVRKAHDLLSEADVVVTWNGKRFDVPHLMREFLEAGLTPPAPFEQIDLCNAVRKQFRFTSNKLQYVSTRLGLAGKVQHEGHTLWVKCMAGDDKAWSSMRTYNKRDVTVLQELYDKLQPWIPGHPNTALREDDVNRMSCSACGGVDIQRRGFAFTKLGKYQRFQCQGCGKWLRSVRRVEGVDIAEVAG